MFDDLATYFYENVVRSFEEYLDVKNSGKVGRSRDIRAAMNAATPLYHLREYLPPTHALSHAQVSGHCPDYGLLGDIVNASKHSTLTRGNPQIGSATQIEELVVTTQYQDAQGPFYSHEKIVVVKLANGSERNVLEVMINVMNFWQNSLHSIGVIRKSRNYGIPVAAQPKSRSECGDERLDFEAVQGLRFHQNFRLQKYNYATGKIELWDLQGGNLEFKIYKPNFEFCLVLKNESLGKEFKKTVVLGEAASTELGRLKTEEEKRAYLDSLPSVQQALRELAVEAGLSK